MKADLRRRYTVPRFGFIHEKLDIKILILFILRRLPGVVEPETLLELCQCDDGVGYFDYTDCLNELIDTKHIEECEGGYKITEKGARNAETVESSLPYSVRTKAERLLEPVAARLRRDAMITTEHERTDDGLFVHLAMSDGKGNIIDLRLLVADEDQAKLIEKNFRSGAEDYYQRIIALVSEERSKKK
jgi:hypothetical protein